MKLGVCTSVRRPEDAEAAAKTGYDYIEVGFADMVMCDDETIDEFIAKTGELGLKCEAANSMLPGTLRVTGEEIDYEALADFLEEGMARAAKIGIEVVVFGSAKARNVPKDFPREKAIEQLAFFLREYCGPIAEKYGIKIAIEPLGALETNIILTVREGEELARLAGRENVKVLADNFHMAVNDDAVENISGMVIHAHISNADMRCFPEKDDDFDYLPFINALKAVGCPRCSIEAGTGDFAEDAENAFECLKPMFE